MTGALRSARHPPASPQAGPEGLRLDPEAARRAPQGPEAELRRIFGARRYVVAADGEAVHLLGPDTSYHALDPDLPAVLSRMGLAGADAAACRRRSPAAFECFEDVWSGPFIAEIMADAPEPEPLCLIHVDDHRDMMPAMMGPGRGKPLVDLATGRAFDPWCAEDWAPAIASGAVGIGSFLTPFLHGRRRVHIRHLVNRPGDLPDGGIEADFARPALLPGTALACVRPSPAPFGGSTYRTDTEAGALLEALPPGRIVVHIDLDYFVNDFNGNPGQAARPRGAARAPGVTGRMDRLFAALAGRAVAGWIVATSPGFCAARHWAALLAMVSEGIAQHRAGGAP